MSVVSMSEMRATFVATEADELFTFLVDFESRMRCYDGMHLDQLFVIRSKDGDYYDITLHASRPKGTD